MILPLVNLERARASLVRARHRPASLVTVLGGLRHHHLARVARDEFPPASPARDRANLKSSKGSGKSSKGSSKSSKGQKFKWVLVPYKPEYDWSGVSSSKCSKGSYYGYSGDSSSKSGKGSYGDDSWDGSYDDEFDGGWGSVNSPGKSGKDSYIGKSGKASYIDDGDDYWAGIAVESDGDDDVCGVEVTMMIILPMAGRLTDTRGTSTSPIPMAL